MEEKELVKKARSGDRQAFAKLYEMIYKDLYRFALFTLRNQVDAEDAVSESVIAAYESIHKLKNSEAFKSWMFCILANQCKKVWKKKEYLEDKENSKAVDIFSNHEEHMDLWESFSALEKRERMVLAMHVFAGYSSKEIGKMLKIAPGTVRSIKSRATSRMRNMLGGESV